jgi:hypothetical protein
VQVLNPLQLLPREPDPIFGGGTIHRLPGKQLKAGGLRGRGRPLLLFVAPSAGQIAQ